MTQTLFLNFTSKTGLMAHHYAGGSPDEAAQVSDFDVTIESFSVPGGCESHDVEAMLDLNELMEDGDLVPAEVVKAQRIFGKFISEYEEDSQTLRVFLGYAENGWSSEEMWRKTDYSRQELYSSTEVLEEQYGLVETDFGDVSLTHHGADVHTAFETLREYED